MPSVDSVVIEGRGRFRRRPLPWLAFANTIWLRPGIDRVSDMVVRVGPVTVLRVLDAYVDGRGITKFLNTADAGPRIDQGAFHPMLCEALMFPSGWSELQSLAWEPVDERTVRLAVPHAAETEVATVGFDAAGYPAAYEAMRFKGTDGPKVPWRVAMLDWHRFGPVAAPGRIVVRWADEPGAWLRLGFDRVEVDRDLAEPLARARAAIAATSG